MHVATMCVRIPATVAMNVMRVTVYIIFCCCDSHMPVNESLRRNIACAIDFSDDMHGLEGLNRLEL